MHAKQRIHKWSLRTNMAVKYILHMHITAEVKAYWLICLDLIALQSCFLKAY